MTYVVGVYGGAFDPPHFGHLMVVQGVVNSGLVDKVHVLPAYKHPYGKNMADFELRLRMCEHLLGHLAHIHLTEMYNPTGFTVDLLRILIKYRNDVEYRLILSSETFMDGATGKWIGWEDLMKLTRPIIVLRGDSLTEELKEKAKLHRADIIDQVIPEISSTNCRKKLAEGVLPVEMPRQIAAYALNKNLYRK